MFENPFGPAFDFDRSGDMDAFEQRAAFTSYLDLLRQEEGISQSLEDMDSDTFDDLVSRSGVDPSEFGI